MKYYTCVCIRGALSLPPRFPLSPSHVHLHTSNIHIFSYVFPPLSLSPSLSLSLSMYMSLSLYIYIYTHVHISLYPFLHFSILQLLPFKSLSLRIASPHPRSKVPLSVAVLQYGLYCLYDDHALLL